MIWINMAILLLCGLMALAARKSAKEENWPDALGWSLAVFINLAVFIAPPGGGQ